MPRSFHARLRIGYIYVLPGRTIQSKCAGGPADDMDAFYCPTDEKIYLGHEQVWGFYHFLGDASMLLVVGHEVIHDFEKEAGVYEYFRRVGPGGEVSADNNVLAKNAADCGSGAYMNHLNDYGGLNGEQDLNDVSATLAAIADAARHGRSHGRLSERVESFFLSLNSALDRPMNECNTILPAQVPLATY